jgi:hypothetical protein
MLELPDALEQVSGRHFVAAEGVLQVEVASGAKEAIMRELWRSHHAGFEDLFPEPEGLARQVLLESGVF